MALRSDKTEHVQGSSGHSGYSKSVSHLLTTVVAVCTRPVHEQTRQNHRMERGGGQEMHPQLRTPWQSIAYWKKEIQFSLKVLPLGGPGFVGRLLIQAYITNSN